MKKTRQAFEAMEAVTDGIAMINDSRNIEHHEPFIWINVKKVSDGIDFDKYGQVKLSLNDQNPDEVIQMFEMLIKSDPFVKKCLFKAMVKTGAQDATQAVKSMSDAFQRLSESTGLAIVNKYPSGGIIEQPQDWRVKDYWMGQRLGADNVDVRTTQEWLEARKSNEWLSDKLKQDLSKETPKLQAEAVMETFKDFMNPSAEMEAGRNMEGIVRAIASCGNIEPKLNGCTDFSAKENKDYSIQLEIQNEVTKAHYTVTNLKGDEDYSKCENAVTDYFNDLHVFFFYSCQDRKRIILIENFKTLKSAVESGWDIYKFNF